MRKISGILVLLIVVCVVTALLSDRFLVAGNVENLLRRTALFGIMSIGAAFVIIVGGIDLSIGSVIALVGCLLPWLTTEYGVPVPLSLLIMVAVALLIGLFHGVVVTRGGIQPFVLTLCGLLMYRGIARGLTGDQTQGFGLTAQGIRAIATGRIPVPGVSLAIPVPLVILCVVALVAMFVLNGTVWGRYMKAIGNNERAARYCGIKTGAVIVGAYAVCAVLSGISGALFVFDVNSAQPSDFGNFYELYAIAAAVLGGCSLRGGEGTIVGVILGAAVMQVLRNAIVLLDVPTQLEFAVIGGVLLIGALADRAAVRRQLAG